MFVVAGIAFKFGAVPFHMWLPDVYQGTPTVVTLLIAARPQARLVRARVPAAGRGADVGLDHWHQMLIVLAVLSLALGNLAAIAQTNFKRMLAYSAISPGRASSCSGCSARHTGGDAGLPADGFGSSMFYAITYVLTTLGTFGMIQLLARKGFEAEQIDDFKGLAQPQPLDRRRHDDR